MTSLRFLGLAALSLSACQIVAGVEDRPVDPIKGGCALPTAGNASIRFTNLVPNEAHVDICVRQSGEDFGRPVLRGGGSACPNGFAYAEQSARFAVPSGKIDVKVIPAGGTCSAPALSSIQGVVVAKGSITTLVRMGNEKSGESLRAYPETTAPPTSGKQKLRLINASPGSEPFDVAIASSPRLPADMQTPVLLAPLTYGASTTGQSKASFPVTADGYLEFPNTQINIGAAPTGAKRATVVTILPGAEGTRSVYLMGDHTKPYFPVRGLDCVDNENSSPLLTRCTPTALGTLSVDIFHGYLYGRFAQDEDAREEYVVDAIAKRDADLMCVVGIQRKTHRDAIVDAAKAAGTFAYSITAQSDLDTQPSDPRDQRPPYTTPPCGGTVSPAAVDAALGCLISKCSTTGTPDGYLQGGSTCISSSCASQFIPLLAGNKDEKRCFNCLTTSSLSDDTHTETKAFCTASNQDYKQMRGQTGSMVLSRYPLSDVQTFFQGATSNQRVIHYAKVAIERDKSIDFFCAELSPAFGALVPYHGFYATNPDPNVDPWGQEQTYQANRLIEFVKAKAGSRPALLSGDFATSQAYTAPDGAKIDAQNPEVLDLLNKAFTPAFPPGFIPRCTECAAPANPYNGDLNIFQFRTYLVNMPASSAVGAGTFFTESVVPLSTGAKVPLSDRWGFETLVLRP